jgi:lipase chaperone LimK
MRRWLPAAIAGTLAALFVFLRSSTHDQSELELGTASEPKSDHRYLPALRPAPPAAHHDLERSSLFGTQMDGALPVDRRGNLVVGVQIRRAFEYFTSLFGEQSEATIDAYVRTLVARELDEPARNQALRLWRDYLRYRIEARDSLPDIGALSFEEQLARISELRERIFGQEVANAFFADEQQTQRVDIERLRVLEDTTLSEKERAEYITALEEQLPPSEIETRRNAHLVRRLARAEVELEASGDVSPEERRALRERIVGVEAAKRLDRLDQERAEWRARLAEFCEAREAIMAAEMSDEEKQEATQRLLDERFDRREQLRVRVIDKMR